jgi:hypothetical protein
VIIRTAFRQRRAAVLLAAVSAALILGLAACGGSGGGEEDAETLLDRAFSQPIPSADVEIDAELEIDGLPGLEEPVRMRAAGPYVRAEKTLPQLDMDVEIGAQGAGQAIQSGILSTGDRVFLKFGGAFFEQPREQVAAANRRLARQEGRGEGSLSDLGLDPRDWVIDASVEGEEEVGGVTTEHVRGALDVEALVTDLNDLVKQSRGALGQSGDAPEPLGRRDIERLSESVEKPSFDIYVGKDDDVVRRISLRLDVSVPEGDREDVNGVSGASIRLSAELSDVGGDQSVRAPRSSRPISDLAEQLGGLSALAGAGGLGGGGGAATTPVVPDTPGSTGDGAGGDAGVEDFERYGDCLEQAAPDDAEAISRCARLLGGGR